MKIVRRKDIPKELADELDKEMEDILASESPEDEVIILKAKGEFADAYHKSLKAKRLITKLEK